MKKKLVGGWCLAHYWLVADAKVICHDLLWCKFCEPYNSFWICLLKTCKVFKKFELIGDKNNGQILPFSDRK